MKARSVARELSGLAAGFVSNALNALIPSNAERRARTYLTTLTPTVDNGFSPADIQAMMHAGDPLTPAAGEELIEDITKAEAYFIPRVRNGRLITTADQFRSGGQTYETGPRPTLTVPRSPASPAGKPTGAGQTPPSGTGEARAYDRATSVLLHAAANQLEKARGTTGSIGYLYLGELIHELRDRAAMFEAIED